MSFFCSFACASIWTAFRSTKTESGSTSGCSRGDGQSSDRSLNNGSSTSLRDHTGYSHANSFSNKPDSNHSNRSVQSFVEDDEKDPMRDFYRSLRNSDEQEMVICCELQGNRYIIESRMATDRNNPSGEEIWRQTVTKEDTKASPRWWRNITASVWSGKALHAYYEQSVAKNPGHKNERKKEKRPEHLLALKEQFRVILRLATDEQFAPWRIASVQVQQVGDNLIVDCTNSCSKVIDD